MEWVSLAPGALPLVDRKPAREPFGWSRTVSRDHSLSCAPVITPNATLVPVLRLLWPVYRPRDRQDSRLATSGKHAVLELYNQIVARDLDTRENLVSVSDRQSFSTSTLNPEALRGLRIASSDTIYAALSNRRLIGDHRMKLATLCF